METHLPRQQCRHPRPPRQTVNRAQSLPPRPLPSAQAQEVGARLRRQRSQDRLALPDLAHSPAKPGPSHDNTMHLTVPAFSSQATKAFYQEILGLLVSRQRKEALLGQGKTTWSENGAVARFLVGFFKKSGREACLHDVEVSWGG